MRICPRLLEVLVRWHYSHIANSRYHDLGSTRARTITRTHVVVNMCHIKFALTGRKEGSEDRNAVGINVELGSPFLQGISCLVERWGPDGELWHRVLSHFAVLQLNTHTFSWTPSVCGCKLLHNQFTHLTLARTLALKYSEDCRASTNVTEFSSISMQDKPSKVEFSS